MSRSKHEDLQKKICFLCFKKSETPISPKSKELIIERVYFEHVHGDFIETWKNFKVHPTHPDYRKQFKSCVVNYDSHHISYI